MAVVLSQGGQGRALEEARMVQMLLWLGPTVAGWQCDGCFSNRLLESSGLALPFWGLIVENQSRALNKFYFVSL